ncbi:MAG TPA: hypothetical protein VII06_14370 [Chloroflexota bacterium]|jgi:hypothetical protein
MNQAKNATLPTRTPHDGWVELWELIYGEPWPFKGHGATQWLAAYLDWKRDQ